MNTQPYQPTNPHIKVLFIGLPSELDEYFTAVCQQPSLSYPTTLTSYEVGGIWPDSLLMYPEIVGEVLYSDPNEIDTAKTAQLKAALDDPTNAAAVMVLTSQCQVGCVDITRARQISHNAAHAVWDDFAAITVSIEAPKSNYVGYLETLGGDAAAATQAYQTHPWIVTLRNAGLIPPDHDPFDYYHQWSENPELTWLYEADLDALGKYVAFVHDGQWFGSPALWPTGGDFAADLLEWKESLVDVLAGLDPATWLSVVDCTTQQ